MQLNTILARLTICTSEWTYFKAKQTKIYSGATHQSHITENKFQIQTYYIYIGAIYILARLTESTSPKIHSKSKHIIFWRDSPGVNHHEYITNPNDQTIIRHGGGGGRNRFNLRFVYTDEFGVRHADGTGRESFQFMMRLNTRIAYRIIRQGSGGRIVFYHPVTYQ